MESVSTWRRIAALAFALYMPLAGLHPGVAEARCPERPRCSGCGCKGGPGYRGPDGRCVGFKNLAKVCGAPAEMRCTFENAPGTGLNRDCVLAPERRKTHD